MTFENIIPSLEFCEAMLPLTCEWASEREHAININWAAYQKLFENDMLRSYAIMDEGKMVGFSVFIISPSLCQQDVVRAQMEILYLAPQFRSGLAGFKFIKFCEQELIADGVADEIVFAVVPQRDYSKLLKRLQYESIETLYRKKV